MTRWGSILSGVLVLTTMACGPPGRSGLTTGPGYGPPDRSRRPPAASLTTADPGDEPSPDPSGSVARRCLAVESLVRAAAERHGLDPALLMGMARVESRYRPDIRNRRSGATGIMQIMPATGTGFGCGDLLDPAENIECGARVLARYMAIFAGDRTYAVAAYHAGPGRVRRDYEAGRLPRNMRYVNRVLEERTRYLRHGCR